MMRDELSEALSDLGSMTIGQWESVVRAENAPLERRVAGIICLVTASKLSIAADAFKLILDLTSPEWKANDHPHTTDFGRCVHEFLALGIDELLQIKGDGSRTVMACLAARVVSEAKSGGFMLGDAPDVFLNLWSGRDSVWWIDWINQQRR